jgi:hypothetical protein
VEGFKGTLNDNAAKGCGISSLGGGGHHIPEDSILYDHHRENPNSYTDFDADSFPHISHFNKLV